MFTPCNRAVNERQSHRFPEFGESESEHCGRPRGLAQKTLKFRKDGMVGVCLEADCGAIRFATQQPEVHQRLQLPMGRSRARSGLPGDLAQVKPLVGMPQNIGEQCGASATKQGVGERFKPGCSHVENKCTQYENALQDSGGVLNKASRIMERGPDSFVPPSCASSYAAHGWRLRAAPL